MVGGDLMESLTRQMDIIPMDKLGQKITVIGAGAIGSCAVMALAKMGFSNISIYDFDKVEEVNLNNQWFMKGDVGRFKVEALRDMVQMFTGFRVEAINHRFEAQPLHGIVISSVDSMKVRAQIWDSFRKSQGASWLIDPRMASEYALQYVMANFDAKDAQTYQKVLYSDEKAVQERCTAKATMYTSMGIGAHVAKAVKDIVTDNSYARITHWNIKQNYQQTWAKAQ